MNNYTSYTNTASNLYKPRDSYENELPIELKEEPASGSLSSDKFLSSLVGGQLRYDFLSADTIRQMIYERSDMRDKNRTSIFGLIGDLAGDISCCENLNGSYGLNSDAPKKLLQLQKTKLDLERQLLSEDVDFWRDTFMLRRDLVVADKQYNSTKLRTGLFAGGDGNYDTKQSSGSMGAGYLSGSQTDHWRYSR